MSEIDAGRRCLGCDGIDMEVAFDKATCRTCGYATSIAQLVRSKVQHHEIESLTKRDDFRER